MQFLIGNCGAVFYVAGNEEYFHSWLSSWIWLDTFSRISCLTQLLLEGYFANVKLLDKNVFSLSLDDKVIPEHHCDTIWDVISFEQIGLHLSDGREQAPSSHFLQRLPKEGPGVCDQDHPDQAQEERVPDADQPWIQRLHGVPVGVGGERP